MAKILASEGYIVFAVDLYDGRVATESSGARELMSAVRSDPDSAVAKLKAAAEFLRTQGATKIGSLGWCFGGGQSLQLALNDDLDATVIYYGQLTDDESQLENIDWPVLGVFGAEDSSISEESIENFESALDDLGIENDIYVYPGVGHAFANPSGTNYAPDETIDAWEKTVSFLDENLKS